MANDDGSLTLHDHECALCKWRWTHHSADTEGKPLSVKVAAHRCAKCGNIEDFHAFDCRCCPVFPETVRKEYDRQRTRSRMMINLLGKGLGV